MGRVRPCQPRGARRKNFMARIAGVNIPTNKRVVIALTYIHGIGSTKAKEITEKLGIAPERRVQDLTDQEVLQIRETIDADHNVEGDLRRETAMNRSEEHTSELQSLMRISYAVFCFKKKHNQHKHVSHKKN